MIKVGKHTYGHAELIIRYPSPDVDLIIGSFCSIAQRVTIFQKGDHHPDWLTTYPFGIIFNETFPEMAGKTDAVSRGDIVIGNDVWIGEGTTIMGGARIGDGAIIAANSHVIGRIKPYSIAGGNPATHYCFRFNEDIIKKLLDLRWWEWEDSEINKITPILCSNDYQKILDYERVCGKD